MKEIRKYENVKVLVLGLAKSGVSAAKLLHQLGAMVTVNDGKPFEENPEAQDLLSMGIKVITGSHPIELLDEDFSLMVKNPGIPYSNPLVAKAQELNIPVITEVELAYEIAECPIIGITGTNGKTTTTTMISLLLNADRKAGTARLSGNIGFPASTIAVEAKPEDELVMELSSFQLMGTRAFKPKIAVITNIFEAHLDYHGSREAYKEAKWKIQANMTDEDFLVINYSQKELIELAETSNAAVVPFTTAGNCEAGAYLKDGGLWFKDERIMDSADLGVPGKHNIENALAAIAVAKLKNVSSEAIAKTLTLFSGVPHRTQYIGEISGRKFYNDSKATNILAAKMAVSGFENEKLILLAGGLDRGNDFDELVPSIINVKAMIVFGETAVKLAEAGEEAGIKTIIHTENTETAVPIAFENSTAGDAILLSPACASWDQYPNFEIRGDKFIQAVQKLRL